MIDKTVLNVKEVSQYLGIGLTKTYELFHSKDFPCFSTGKKSLRVRKCKLDLWIENMENKNGK